MRISDWSSDVCSSDLVDDVAAVDPHEAVGVELRGDAGDGAAQRVVAPAHAQVHVVAGGLQPFDVAGGDQELAAQLADQEALRARLLPGRRTVVRRIEQARLAPPPSPDPTAAGVDE